MPKAVVLTGYVPPDVLVWRNIPLPEPGPGHVRLWRPCGGQRRELARRPRRLRGVGPRVLVDAEAGVRSLVGAHGGSAWRDRSTDQRMVGNCITHAW